jgi:hypothetical protein
MLSKLHNSPNFENLICFNPSLKWMHYCFTDEIVNQVLNQCKDSIDDHYPQNFLIVAYYFGAGKDVIDLFILYLEKGLIGIVYWSLPIQIEARKILGLISKIRIQRVFEIVIDILSTQFNEAILYVFSDFLFNYFFNTSVPFNEKLVSNLLHIYTTYENKKSLVKDIQNIFFSIASNPVRFLEILNLPEQEYKIILSILKDINQFPNSFYELILFPSTFHLTTSKTGLKISDEINSYSPDSLLYIPKFDVELPIAVSLHTELLPNFLTILSTTFDDNLIYFILQIFTILVLQRKPLDENF